MVAVVPELLKVDGLVTESQVSARSEEIKLEKELRSETMEMYQMVMDVQVSVHSRMDMSELMNPLN